MSENQITGLTRRNLFDELRLTDVEWAGRLEEDEFLSRIFNLAAMGSGDTRCKNMAQDVHRHRVAWGKCDWDHDWAYDDPRLNLLHCPDEVYLRFLCEMVHPIVRSEESDARSLAATFNRHLVGDGYEIVPGSFISGKPIFIGRPLLESVGGRTDTARRVADDFGSQVISAQITRMEASVQSDPALAIGSAKEFVETICKGILTRTGSALTGREDLPKLMHLTRTQLKLGISRDTDETLKRTLSSLATITQGIAELRGQIGTGHGPDPHAAAPQPEVARLAVGMAVALGVFLYETYRVGVPETP